MDVLIEMWRETEIALPFSSATAGEVVRQSALLLLFLGFVVGALGGFFGTGGGWLVTPVLMILGLPPTNAVATGLANISCQATSGALRHIKLDNVDYRLWLLTGLPMIGGVQLGKMFNNYLESQNVASGVLLSIYAVFLVLLGAYILNDAIRRLRDGSEDDDEDAAEPGHLTRVELPPVIVLRSCGLRISLWMLIGMGLGVGLLAGVLGVGGGVALVPVFIYLVGVPLRIGVGTSLLCVTVSSAFGTFTYGMDMRVEVIAVIWLVIGSLVGTQFGVAATNYVHGKGLRLLYGSMLFVAAAAVMLELLDLNAAAGLVSLGGAGALTALILGWMWWKMFRGGDEPEEPELDESG
jgi:hypothetical protein